MTNAWISEAMQMGLRLVGWPFRATPRPDCKPAGPTEPEELSEFKSLAAQTNKLLTFQNDFILPLMEGLQRGQHTPATSKDCVERFVRRVQELGLQTTHPALKSIADAMRSIGEKDFSLYETSRDLNRLTLSIEEAERTMNNRRREVRVSHSRRPSDRK